MIQWLEWTEDKGEGMAAKTLYTAMLWSAAILCSRGCGQHARAPDSPFILHQIVLHQLCIVKKYFNLMLPTSQFMQMAQVYKCKLQIANCTSVFNSASLTELCCGRIVGTIGKIFVF